MKTLILSAALALTTLNAAQAASSPAQEALKVLNQKDHAVRKAVLAARAENCVALSTECKDAMDASDNNAYTFTARDLVAVAFVGRSSGGDPCKQEQCEGENYETRTYAVLVRADFVSRWATDVAVVTLRLDFVRATSQNDGKVTRRIELTKMQDQLREAEGK